jgi:HSP20 family protein
MTGYSLRKLYKDNVRRILMENEENKASKVDHSKNEPWFSFQNEIRDLFGRFKDEWPDLAPLNKNGFVPHIDVIARDNSIYVIAEVPGMNEKDIHLSFEKNTLTIEGEKKTPMEDSDNEYTKSEISYGHFYREIALEEDIDENNTEAIYKDGIIIVRLVKMAEKQKNKKIEIRTLKLP